MFIRRFSVELVQRIYSFFSTIELTSSQYKCHKQWNKDIRHIFVRYKILWKMSSVTSNKASIQLSWMQKMKEWWQMPLFKNGLDFLTVKVCIVQIDVTPIATLLPWIFLIYTQKRMHKPEISITHTYIYITFEYIIAYMSYSRNRKRTLRLAAVFV